MHKEVCFIVDPICDFYLSVDTGTFESVSLEDETFLVNTTTCKIPYFDPWDKMATVNIKRDCDKRPEFNIETICPTRPVRRWAYVDDSVQPVRMFQVL